LVHALNILGLLRARVKWGIMTELREESAMKKAKKRVFSIVKAVKANARDRVGSPPPEKVLPDPKQKAAAKPKHKETLADLLEKRDGDG
jgi:hypothetical protein